MPLSRLLAVTEAPGVRNATPAPNANTAIFASRILIVDDVATNREIIATYLGREGYWNLEFAENGAAALEKVGHFAPDLVILDIVMPEIDGFEVCRRLRRAPATSGLPILVQTSLDEAEERAEIFKAGATDLVSRPLNRYELLARVGIQLDRRHLIENLRGYHDRTQQDLRLARAMQQGLLPSPRQEGTIAQRCGLKIASHAVTSSELGGDFWGIRELGERRIAITFADFSGHGIAAAMNTFRLHTLIAELAKSIGEPDKFLDALNLRLVHLLMPGQFATMLHGVLDRGAEQFFYASAGAPRPFLRSGVGQPLRAIESAGVPLGVSAQAQYPRHAVPFETGGLLFLYSDALVEIEGRYKEEQLLATLASHAEGTPQEIIRATCAAMFAGIASPVEDDLTVICVRAAS